MVLNTDPTSSFQKYIMRFLNTKTSLTTKEQKWND